MSNIRISIGSVTNCAGFAIGDNSQVVIGDKTYINGKLVSEPEVTADSSAEDDEEPA